VIGYEISETNEYSLFIYQRTYTTLMKLILKAGLPSKESVLFIQKKRISAVLTSVASFEKKGIARNVWIWA
jgi:hypothetical protein